MARDTVQRERKVGNSKKTFFAVLVIVVLVFTILAGLLKDISLPGGKTKQNFKWDSKSSFAIALDTNPPSLFIYQREPKRIVFLGLDKNMYFITGNSKVPIAQIGNVISGKNDLEIAKMMTLAFGAPVTNYVTFNKAVNLDNKTAQKMFKDFASLATPFVIFTKGKPGFVKNTNITRYDAFRLWWQIKGFSVDSVNIADYSALTEDVVSANGKKVLGADTSSLNRKVHDFLENINVEKEGYNIHILNESGNQYATVVASYFIKSVGGNVSSENEGDSVRDISQIVAGKGSYTASYLANMFGCDIRELVSSDLERKEAQNNGSTTEVTVVLGRDFAEKYFK